jgi:hypothetical protein
MKDSYSSTGTRPADASFQAHGVLSSALRLGRVASRPSGMMGEGVMDYLAPL